MATKTIGRENRIICDIDRETHKALMAYSEATGKKRSTIVREFLKQARPAIKKMTVKIHQTREAQSPQIIIEAFSRSAQVIAELGSDEK